MTNVSPALRLGSMLVDHIVMSFAMSIIVIPFLAVSIFRDFSSVHRIQSPFWSAEMLGMAIIFAVYFCKDSFNGRSVAKRMLKLQVIDKSGSPAGVIQCCIRNLTIPFWPIEVIIVLFSPARRLGDVIAGTRTVAYEGAVSSAPVKWYTIIVALLIAYGYVTLLFYWIDRFISSTQHWLLFSQ